MIYKKTLILALALISLSKGVEAQTNGSNSPYSRYGFGLLSDQSQGFNKGMAGTGIALRSGHELNFKNPASYSAIDSLTFIFDVGVSLQNSNIISGKNSTNAKNTSLDYIMAGYRVRKNFGMTLGLLPYSTIGYSMSTTTDLQNVGTGVKTKTETYNGDGGLHEVFAGLGWQPFKGFSFGANVGMLWGTMTNTILASFSESSVQSLRRQYYGDILSYKLDFGAQYEQRINDKNIFNVGFTYGLGHKIKNRSKFYSQTLSSSTVANADTLIANDAYGLPNTYGIGLSWSYNNRLRVATDYTYSQWSKVKYPQATTKSNSQEYKAFTGAFSDTHKFSLGLEFIPNPEGMHWRNYITYQVGFSMSSSYIKIQDANNSWQDGPRSYVASAGVKLPIVTAYNNRSVVNLGIQYERIQPKIAGMLKENYLRFCVGVTFDERWFAKWKVE